MPRSSSPVAKRPVARKRQSAPLRMDAKSSDVAPSLFDHSHGAYHRRTLGQHGAHITMLWILLLSFSFAGAMMMLNMSVRLSNLEESAPRLVALESLLNTEEARLNQLIEAVNQLNPTGVTTTPLMPNPTVPPTSTPPTSTNTTAPVPASAPSAGLSRGSVSPDGTKYAGYEDVKVGKKGLAVELLNLTTGRRERYIVIFSLSESTGIGTAFEKDMSVLWKDANTIQYDVLVKKGQNWVKETREVNIFI